MRRIAVRLGDQVVGIETVTAVAAQIEFMFGPNLCEPCSPVTRSLRIEINEKGNYTVIDGNEVTANLSDTDLPVFVAEAVVRNLVTDLTTAVALHTGCVAHNGKAILIAGASGAGKTSLTAWFVEKGFDYVTDEVAILSQDQRVNGLQRALVLKLGSAEKIIGEFEKFRGAPKLSSGEQILSHPNRAARFAEKSLPCSFIIFPKFRRHADLRIQSISAAETAMLLVGCNLNARNLADGGFRLLSTLSRATPAIMVEFGSFDELDGVLDVLARFMLDSSMDGAEKRRFLTAFPKQAQASDKAGGNTHSSNQVKFPIPSPTPKRPPRTLTVAMATYDDYDGVYFSLQAIRMYHSEVVDEVDFLVIDNRPDGPCAKSLKNLEAHIPNYRYVPFVSWSGTAVRDAVFAEAESKFVLCMDCHVFIVPGALARLLAYMKADPDCKDLLQGPLIYDGLNQISTHFHPGWRAGMFGYWANDPRGEDADGPAFDIPMQGLGLFACTRAAWPGFNPMFRGFGGEEGYIHEKFRLRGGRALCLPFLRWLHRFERPLGVPYKVRWEDRIRNYVIGFCEVGWPLDELEVHFRELLGDSVANPILDAAKAEAASLFKTQLRMSA